jgi:hypothetical protein
MLALDALLQLRVDVERHLRIGVADLPHDPEDVEAIGEQRDRDVGAAQGVRRGVGQRRQAAVADALGRARSGLADDPCDALTGDPPAAGVRKGVGVGVGAPAGAARAIEVRDELLDELWAHLHLAYARLGLGVGDPETRAFGVVQAYLADAQIAELAGPDAAARQRPADRATTLILARRLDTQADQVVADRGLGEPSAAAMSLDRMPWATARATSARVPSDCSRDASSARVRGSSCSPAASMSATSSSISRNVRVGLGP